MESTQNVEHEDKDEIPPLDMADLPYQGWKAERDILRQMLRDAGVTEDAGPLELVLNRISGQLADDSPNKASIDQARRRIRTLPGYLDSSDLAGLLDDVDTLSLRISEFNLTALVEELRKEGALSTALLDSVASRVATLQKLVARLAPDLECFDCLTGLQALVNGWRTVLHSVFPFPQRYLGSSPFSWQDLEIVEPVAPTGTILHLEFYVRFVDRLATRTLRAVGPGLQRRLASFVRAWNEYLGSVTPFLGLATPPSLPAEALPVPATDLPDYCDRDVLNRLWVLLMKPRSRPIHVGQSIAIKSGLLRPPETGNLNTLEAAATIDGVSIAAQNFIPELLRLHPREAAEAHLFYEELNDYLRSVQPIFGDAIIGQVDLTILREFLAKADEAGTGFLRDAERVLNELIESVPEYSRTAHGSEVLLILKQHPRLRELVDHYVTVQTDVIEFFNQQIDWRLHQWAYAGLVAELDRLLEQWIPSLEKAMPAGASLGDAVVRWEEIGRSVRSVNHDGPRDAQTLHACAVHAAHLAQGTVADLAARSPRPERLLRELAPFFTELNAFLAATWLMLGEALVDVDLSPLGTLETADEYDENVEPPNQPMEVEETPYSSGMDLDEDVSPFYA